MRILISTSILVFLIFGFQKSETSITEIDFHEALSKTMISVEPVSNGKHSGKSVQLKLNNLTTKRIAVKIPALTTYLPKNNEEQTLLQVEEMIVELNQNEVKQILVPAFCSKLRDRSPKRGGVFFIGKSENDKFSKLAEYIQKNPQSKYNYQEAVWAISDNQPISHMRIETPEDKAFRKFMSGLTGQKESWYSSPQETYVDPYGNINRETVRISGGLKFNSDGVSKVYQAIYDSTGNALFKGTERQLKKIDNVEMTFSIKVKGWKKGNYEVHVLSNEMILKKFPFIV